MTFAAYISSPSCRRVALSIAAAVCLVGAPSCSSQSSQQGVSDVQPEHSYLTPRYLSEAIDKLLAPLPKPVRLLSITALNRVVVLQVQNPERRGSVDEYRFADGKVTGPVPVELKGAGKLADNLFRVDSFEPHVAEKVLTTIRSEYSEEIRKLVVTRNLPTSMDIQFRVFLKTGTGDRIIAADKSGRLLGPLTAAPSPPNVVPSTHP